MRRLGLWSSLLLLLVAGPAHAQIAGRPFEFSGQAGIFSPDARSHVQAGPAYGFSLGYRWQSWLVTEAYGLFAPSQADTAGEPTVNFSSFGLDLRFNLRPGESPVVPYLFAGFGVGRSHATGSEPDMLERGAPSIGGGALFNLRGAPRWSLQLQVRDLFFQERGSDEMNQHFAATLGLHYLWGGRVRDADLDGVRDWLDRCPGTPIGARVDARGCPLDADADSVFDGIDQCPDTPRGARVDARGCPTDSDGDKVWDGIDQCPDTPAGASVDPRGCPNDRDEDKVVDGIDQCPDTPRDCPVDERGCPKDADGDGVCDGRDQCADTSPGLKVDDKGCPMELIERETELLDTGMMRFNNINFATNSAELEPASLPTLDLVGTILTKWPELRIEIGGHTDARGSNAHNQRLSERRAGSVRTYLVEKFPALNAAQYTARGYGESRPVVPNRDEASWALNRRVEFVVLNKDVLKREIERRRLLQKSEPAPADTTQQR